MGEKKIAEAYILGIPFGLFGAHNFYLGRRNFGILYACTLGLFGIGYLYDLIRMKWLVRHANRYGTDRKMVTDCYLICAFTGLFGGHHFYLGNKKLGIFYACTLGVFLVGWIVDLIRMKYLVEDYNRQRHEKSLGTAYVLGLSPLGIFGAYHYYLDNVQLGLIYTFTLGIFGIGWIVDLFRMKKLVRKAGMDKKSVGTAYIMSMPPFGLFGAYHYYLGNYALGITYTLTLGVFSVGWIVDLFRMKGLVKAANDPTSDHGMTKITAYVLCASPLGIFGAHHFYLKRYLNGAFYACTFGLFGFGWIFDMFRLPVLYERFATEDKHKYPDEAYVFWFPFGIFGLHHFYLGNKKWGILYACTLGCLGIGWIIDGIRLPWLLKEFNRTVEDPDMNDFRICRPKCSMYKCKRYVLSMCDCCETFSLSSTGSRKEDTEMRGETSGGGAAARDDFDVIKEMYPDENHHGYGVNDNEVNNQTEAEIATVQESYNVFPDDTQQTTPAYDNGAYPGDPGYDDYPLPSNDDGDVHSDVQRHDTEHAAQYNQNEAYNEHASYSDDHANYNEHEHEQQYNQHEHYNEHENYNESEQYNEHGNYNEHEQYNEHAQYNEHSNYNENANSYEGEVSGGGNWQSVEQPAGNGETAYDGGTDPHNQGQQDTGQETCHHEDVNVSIHDERL